MVIFQWLSAITFEYLYDKSLLYNNELKQILDEPETLKVLAVNNREGVPHVVFKGTLHAEDNQFVFYDLLQSSEINTLSYHTTNLVWFYKLFKERRRNEY